MITFLLDDLYKIWVYMCKLLNWQCQCLVRNSYKNIVWMMSMQNLKMEGWKWRKRILHTLKICCNGHHMLFLILNPPIYQLFSRIFFLVLVKQRLMVLILISWFWSLLAHHMFSRILNQRIYQFFLTKFSLFFFFSGGETETDDFDFH